MVAGRQTGVTTVSISGAATVPDVEVNITNSKALTVLYLEASVSTQRLKYSGPSLFPRTETSEVEVDVLPGLYGFGQPKAPVVVSAVLDDGSRMYVTDYTMLNITSLDPSVVSVSDDGVVTGLSPGGGELVEVTWTLCAEKNMSTKATFEVLLNRNICESCGTSQATARRCTLKEHRGGRRAILRLTFNEFQARIRAIS